MKFRDTKYFLVARWLGLLRPTFGAAALSCVLCAGTVTSALETSAGLRGVADSFRAQRLLADKPHNARSRPLVTQQVKPGQRPAGLKHSDGSSIQSQRAKDRYHASPVSADSRRIAATNPRHRLGLEFDERGLTLAPHSAGWKLCLETRAIGRGDMRTSLSPVIPAAHENRVTYAHDGISEWYLNTEKGLEHGYTVAERPNAGQGNKVWIELAVSGLRATANDGDSVSFFSDDGTVLLTYSKLRVSDARGKILTADLTTHPDSSTLRIAYEDSAAVYPVTVDPLIQTAKLVPSGDGVDFRHDFGDSVALSEDAATLVVGDPDALGYGAAYVYVKDGMGGWELQQRLIAADAGAGNVSGFGDSVAISGDTVVVGSGGSAYVFVRTGSTWAQQQKFTDSIGARFGYSVAISVDTAVVGAFDDVNDGVRTGSADVFVRSGSTWSQQAHLTALDAANFDRFGFSVAISGDTVVVGAPLTETVNGVAARTNVGSAYVFVSVGGVWSQTRELTASDGEPFDSFGTSVAISGDTLVVGAGGHDTAAGSGAGSAYVFARNGEAWSEQQQLTALDGAAGDGFGNSVALSGDTIAVAASGHDTSAGIDAGSAYVFVRGAIIWSQQAQLNTAGGVAGDFFGSSIAISGATVAAGALGHDTGLGTDIGSAYVFVRGVINWIQQAQLTTADDGVADGFFGTSVAISGDTLVAGAFGDDNATGSAYVFVRSNGAWIQQAKLTAADGAEGDYFGASVAISGDTIAVGAPLAFSDLTGSVYVFVRNGETWSQQQQLTAPDGTASSFGSSVAVSGDTAVVTDWSSAHVFLRWGEMWNRQQELPGYNYPAAAISAETLVVAADGSADVFVRNRGAWILQQELTTACDADDFLFVRCVAISGDTIVLGAYADAAGSAYVFARNGETWSQQAMLTAADGADGDNFGTSVAVSGDIVVVGAAEHDSAAGLNAGSAYVFVRSGDTWSQRQKLTASDGAAYDYFGRSVAVFGDLVVVGAPEDSTAEGAYSGSAYVFETDTTPDTFSFTDQTGVQPGAVITSNAITVSGLLDPAPISVSGGAYRVNDGAFVSTPGAVGNGDSVQVRHSASAQFDTTTDTVLTIGGISDTFTSVTRANSPPVATDDAASVEEDSSNNPISVLANDTDVDGHSLTLRDVTQPAHGTASIAGNLALYTPAANYAGPDSFMYTVTDPAGGTDSALVSLTVTPVNDPPLGTNDNYAVSEGGILQGASVLANDTDPDNDPVAAQQVSSPVHGSLTFSSDGTFTYVHGGSETVSDSFSYRAHDAESASNVATVTISITPVNDAPDALDDSGLVEEDGSITVDVLANDFDPDGDSLSITALGAPDQSGTVTVIENKVHYSPKADFHGTETFTYAISDGHGGMASAAVTITVDPRNDTPVASDDAAEAAEDGGSYLISVLANDSDVDGDTLSVTAISQGSADGTVAIAMDGTAVIYTPAANFNGTETFTYTVGDGNGGTDAATVTVHVAGVNDPPAARDFSLVVDEDGVVTGGLGNFVTDPDNETRTYSFRIVSPPNSGQLLANEQGGFDYRPARNFFGTDGFTYQANDGQTDSNVATVTITVTAVNDAPEAISDSGYTVDEGGALDASSVLANDTDPDGDALTAQLSNFPAHGTLTSRADGTFTYVHDGGEATSDSFAYRANDGVSVSNEAIVTIAITPINDPPRAESDGPIGTQEDTHISVPKPGVLANDFDPDSSMTAVLVSGPGNALDFILNSDGGFSYTPVANFNGSDSFTYRAHDGSAFSAVTTVTIEVSAVNDPPTISEIADQMIEEDTSTNPLPFTVRDVETSADSLIVWGSSSDLALVPHDNIVFGGSGENRTVRVTPTAGRFGTVTITVNVLNGPNDSAGASESFQLTVNPVNDAPVAVDDSATVEEDSGRPISVLANDTDPEGSALSISALGTPSAGGTVMVTGNQVQYAPAANFHGTELFTYTVSDGELTDTATVTVTVTPVNDPPQARDDTTTASEDGGSYLISVLANDSDVDGDAFSVTANSQGSAGGAVAIAMDGAALTYTPAPNFNGTETFTYTVSDGAGGSDSATVTAQVAGVNDPPEALDDTATLTEDSGTNAIDVLANDRDIDGDPLMLKGVESPSHGTASVSGDRILYTPAPDYSGPDSFTYTITDGFVTDTARVSLTVTPVGDPGRLQFEQADHHAAEKAGAVTLRVQRTGGSEGPVSVDLERVAGDTTDGLDYTLDCGTLTWADGDAEPKPCELSIMDDALDEHDEFLDLALANPQGGAALGSPGTLHVTILDDDTAGIARVVSGGSTDVSEGGAGDTYTLALTSQPYDVVTITLDSGDQLSVSPQQVFFNANTWNQPQTITVSAVEDDLQEGPQSDTIRHSVSTSDPGYKGLTVPDELVGVTDNDVAGILLSESGGSTRATEGGARDTYSVLLTSQPLDTVMIDLVTDGQVLVSPDFLMFSPSNWNQPQTVTVSAADDAFAEGSHTGAIRHAVISGDVDYNGFFLRDVVASITDDDIASVVVVESGGGTGIAEGGSSDSFTVRLTSQPTDTVTITVTHDSQVMVEPATLTFTPFDYDIVRTVSVSALDDRVAEGDHASSVVLSAESADPVYDDIAIDYLTVLLTDNDVAGVIVTESGGSTEVTEGGATDTYALALSSAPASPVTITLTFGDQVLASPASLSFDSSTFNIPQVVTVQAIDDSRFEGTHSTTITHQVASADSDYHGTTVTPVTITIADNDQPASPGDGGGGCLGWFTVTGLGFMFALGRRPVRVR
jgi:hypothetical protein